MVTKVNFWKDEIAFYYKFIFIKELKNDISALEVGELENKLVYFNGAILDKLRNKVASHEQALAQLFKSTPQEQEENYRNKHRTLLKEIYGIEEHIKLLKKEVFSLVHS